MTTPVVTEITSSRLAESMENAAALMNAAMTGIYGSRDVIDATDPPLDACIVADARYI